MILKIIYKISFYLILNLLLNIFFNPSYASFFLEDLVAEKRKEFFIKLSLSNSTGNMSFQHLTETGRADLSSGQSSQESSLELSQNSSQEREEKTNSQTEVKFLESQEDDDMDWSEPLTQADPIFFQNDHEDCFIGEDKTFVEENKPLPCSPIYKIEDSEVIYKKGKTYYQRGNFKDAFSNFYKASQQKHPKASHAISHMLKYGEGIEIDKREALNWSLKSTSYGYQENSRDKFSNSPSKTLKRRVSISSDLSPLHFRLKREKVEKENINPFEKMVQNTPSSQNSSQESLTPPLIEYLDQIQDKYDVFLIDIVGVIHDGEKPFGNSIETIDQLSKTKDVTLLSNTPRPHTSPAQMLKKMGLKTEIPIVTAGDLVREDLVNKYKNKVIYHLGESRNQEILKGLDVKTTSDLQNADLILLTQYLEDNEDQTQFDSLFHDIVERKLIVLCANSDKTATIGDKLRYCAGTLAQRLENFNGKVQYYGKPHIDFLDYIFNRTPQLKQTSKRKILLIGDTAEKDIKGAQEGGIDSLLVYTGTTAQHSQKLAQSSQQKFEHVWRKVLKESKPTYWIKSIQ